MKIPNILSSIFFWSSESPEKTLYLQKLKEWENKGVEGEERAEAVSEIEAFIDNPEKTQLFFKNYHLTTLPPLGFIAERVKRLNLSDNQLQELPESLEKLHNLEELYLNNNQLQELPEWLGRELHNLVSLDVSCNRDLKEIPLSLLDSLNFKKLDSTRTEITKTLKELKQERQEDRAEIAFHLLSEKIAPRLPESSVSKVNHFIKERLLYLEELEAWGKDGVEGEDREEAVSRINDFINNPAETELSFDECGLRGVPPLGFIAERTTYLDLSQNQLKEIPKSIAELHKLEYLNLGQNQLKEIPKSIAELHKLEYLNLGQNQLKEIPEWVGTKFHNLKNLNLTDNELQKLPESFGQLHNLEVLILFGNQLQDLPGSLVELRNLKFLDLSFNQLKKIPESIAELHKLEFLCLMGNQIKEIPEWLGKLHNLKDLNLTDNPL